MPVHGGPAELGAFFRAVWRLGVRGSRRRLFWKLVAKGLRRGLDMLPRAVTFAIVGESLIRYTEEVVLPRIDASLAELAADASVRAAPGTGLASTHDGLVAAREDRGRGSERRMGGPPPASDPRGPAFRGRHRRRDTLVIRGSHAG